MKTFNNHIGTLSNATNGIAQGQLNALTPHNSIEANYINYYTVYSHYKDSTYNTADSIMLKTLVDGCPVRDGMAVSYARTLYSILYGDYTVYNDFCFDGKTDKNSNNIKSIENHKDALELEIYPNPNSGTFTLYLKGTNSLSEKAEVSIYNALGNKSGQFLLKLDKNSAIFNTNLDNGIYFITVNDSNGNIYQTKRIIVIR